MNRTSTIFGALMLVIAGAWFLWPKDSAEAPIVPETPGVVETGGAEEPVACTMDAKMCPDGSYVGRTGPKCEFAACPEGSVEEITLPPAEGLWMWKNSSQGVVSFKYPGEFGVTYTHPVDWPPHVEVIENAYTCTPGGTEIDEEGKTEKKKVNGQEFCKTVQVEGAAGSVYRNYVFQTVADDKHIMLSFSTQSSQCDNYPAAEKTTCQNEAMFFDLDSVIYSMFQTMEVK